MSNAAHCGEANGIYENILASVEHTANRMQDRIKRKKAINENPKWIKWAPVKQVIALFEQSIIAKNI